MGRLKEKNRGERRTRTKKYLMIQLTPVTFHQSKARKRSIPRKRVGLVLGPDKVDGVEDVFNESGVGWTGRGTVEEMALASLGGLNRQSNRSFSCWKSDGGCSCGEEEGREGEEG